MSQRPPQSCHTEYKQRVGKQFRCFSRQDKGRCWCLATKSEKEKKMATLTMKHTITDHEAAQVERANASNVTPVVFVHGLWLLPSSWDRWVTLFEEAGYVVLTPGWPDDPETVTEAREH